VKQLILDVRPDLQPTLDNFVPGDNAALIAALRDHVTRQDGSVLYLWGPEGSGRTHLLRAAVKLAGDSRPVSYIDANGNVPVAEQTALHAIDDLQAHSEDSLAELFRQLINARANRLSLIIAGDVPPTALNLRADVASRIAQGLVFEMRPLSDAQKTDALLQHASERGMAMSREMIDYLLRHTRRDLPWLMAVLDALDEASLSLARPLTLPLLREILKAE